MCFPALSPPLDTFKDPNILSALCCPELHAVFEVISDAFCSEQHYLRFCLEIELGDFLSEFFNFLRPRIAYCSGDKEKLFNFSTEYQKSVADMVFHLAL